MTSGSHRLAIREASLGDVSTIAALITELSYPATSSEISDRLAHWLPDPMSVILVAEADGRVVGSVSLHAIPYLKRTGRWARIESLIVDESARGTGAGRALIAVAEQTARHWNCLTVEVTSLRSRTDAHAFYRKMGYSDICGQSGRFLKPLSYS